MSMTPLITHLQAFLEIFVGEKNTVRRGNSVSRMEFSIRRTYNECRMGSATITVAKLNGIDKETLPRIHLEIDCSDVVKLSASHAVSCPG